MSEAEISFNAVLRELGIFDQFTAAAQRYGLSLLGYLKHCAEEPVQNAPSVTSGLDHRDTGVGDYVLRRMHAQSDEEFTQELHEAYIAAGGDTWTKEEIRELCRD